MYKKLLALSLALVLCVCPVSAVFDADNSYYSFDPVPDASVGHYLLNAVSSTYATTGWTDTDHDYLNQIRLALTSKTTGTLLGYVISIDSAVRSFDNKLFYIKQNTDYLPNISNNTNDVKSLVNDAKSFLNQIEENTRTRGLSTDQAASVTSAATQFDRLWTSQVVPHWRNGSPDPTWFTSILFNMGYMCTTLLYDDVTFWNDGAPTLFGLVHRLQKTLASDEDIALAEAQKNNRQQIEKDFVSGSSGKTSLGASDFGDLSSVGGSVKDSISLNGQSSISGFTSGLSDSDAAGQGWFSASTRDALDSVSSSSSYDLKRDKGNSDVYNMAGFSEHYSWLYGG